MSSVKPGFGWQSYLQFGLDGTWGTFPTITNRLPVSKMNPRPDISRIRPKSMNGSLAFPAVLAPLTRAMFTLELPLTYNGLMLFFECFMGTDTYGGLGGADAGSNPYTHTWSGFKKFLNSLSFECGMGEITSGKCEKIISAKINKATIRLSTSSLSSEDTIGTLTLEMVALSLTSNATPTTLGSGTAATPATLSYVMGSHVSVNTNSSGVATERTIDWTLEIDNNLSIDRFFLEGTGALSEPHRKSRPKVTLTVNEEFQTRTSLDAFIANTKYSLQTTIASGSNSLDFQMKGAVMQPPEHPFEGDDFMRQKLVYEIEEASAGGGQTMAVVMTNAQATITAVS